MITALSIWALGSAFAFYRLWGDDTDFLTKNYIIFGWPLIGLFWILTIVGLIFTHKGRYK